MKVLTAVRRCFAYRWAAPWLVAAACGRSTGVPADSPTASPATAPQGTAVVPNRRPLEPARAAYLSGWMPLQPTGVPAFARRYPKYDGRGVLIAILDSGTDPGVAGLQQTTTGARKLLDLRDFSAEGSVPLTPVVPDGDRVVVGSRTLTGFGRILSYSVSQQYFAGTIAEIPLGTPLRVDPEAPPGSDLNGNGRYNDTLGVVVARTQSGWALFTDTDGDGSLENERPVHDYLIGRETFAWSWGGPAPLTLAANFTVVNDQPVLDLFFDTSGHGTHVAGIAAGHDLYGIDGFDGVAPGAQLISLKIANNARGGISTTGSMARAMAYAIHFAERRQLPLVVNLSFGVGNEQEGKARIDGIVDSLLAAHPAVLMTVSAGNDGPGLSTLGFPGSAERPVTVGATFPLVFLQRPVDGSALPDPMAFFSARGGGGELAKPDVVAPGVAYSAVPPWNTGHERNAGTSMAAPHVAGLAARIMSALEQEGVPIHAATIKRGLMLTATPLAGTGYLDRGTGVPDVSASLQWVQHWAREHDTVALTGIPSVAYWTFLESGDEMVPPRSVALALDSPGAVRLESSSTWIDLPDVVPAGDSVRFVVRHHDAPAHGRARSVVVTGWGDDPTAGPLFRLVETVVAPFGAGEAADLGPVELGAGDTDRLFFRAEAGRPFEVRVVTGGVFERMFTSLHEPGGMPYRGENGLPAGPADAAAVYHLDGSDVVSGVYQLATAASPVAGGEARIRVRHSPFHLTARPHESDLLVTVSNRSAGAESATIRAALIGGVYRATIKGGGSAEQRVALTLPDWGRDLEIDVEMDRSAWNRFTDFGLTVLDTIGRIVADAPLNYATGRLRLKLEDGHAGLPIQVALLPGLADADDERSWTVSLRVRLYARSAMPLEPTDPNDAGAARVPAGGSRTIGFRMIDSPWALGEGFVPLGLVMAETKGPTWTMRVALAPPAGTP